MAQVHNRPLFWLGLALLGTALLGFLFVADDLRHAGELLGCTGLALAGLITLLVSLRGKRSGNSQ